MSDVIYMADEMIETTSDQALRQLAQNDDDDIRQLAREELERRGLGEGR